MSFQAQRFVFFLLFAELVHFYGELSEVYWSSQRLPKFSLREAFEGIDPKRTYGIGGEVFYAFHKCKCKPLICMQEWVFFLSGGRLMLRS